MIEVWWYELETRALPEGGDQETINISSLKLDICERDDYAVAAKVSSHDPEKGVPFSDHIRPEQDRVSFTAYVSGRQSTTRLIEGARSGTTTLSGGGEAAGIVVPEGEADGRLVDVFSTLRRLSREGVEVDVDGLRRPIEGWAIERVLSPRTIDTAGLLTLDVSLVEMRYAEVEEVEAPSPRVERGRNRRDQGRQRPQERNTGTANRSPGSRSASVSILQGIGVID